MSTEDVVVQVLLRGTSPLMLKLAPPGCAAAAWLTDPDEVRRYSRAVRTATYTYVNLLGHAADRSGRVTVGGTRPAERLLEHLLIPCLARAAAEIAAGPELRLLAATEPLVDESAKSHPPASARSNHHR